MIDSEGMSEGDARTLLALLVKKAGGVISVDTRGLRDLRAGEYTLQALQRADSHSTVELRLTGGEIVDSTARVVSEA